MTLEMESTDSNNKTDKEKAYHEPELLSFKNENLYYICLNLINTNS